MKPTTKRGGHLAALALAAILVLSADAHAQRRGGAGGPGGGNRGGAGGPGGGNRGASTGKGAGGSAGRTGGEAGGRQRGGSQGAGGLRASSGSTRQAEPAQRTPGDNGFQQSLDHIRSNPGSRNENGKKAAAATDARNNPGNRRVADNAAHDVRGGNQPFSAAWYADHPQAWQFANPHADAYAAATAPNMRSWWAVPATGAVPVATPVATAPAGSAPAAGTPGNGAPSAENQGEWLPIGVFNLNKKGMTETTRAIQLATSHSGEVKGNQIDLLTDVVTEVHGRFDEKNNTLQWTLGQSNTVVFKARLESFQQPGQPIPLQVLYADGTTSEWVMTAVEQTAGETKNGE